jgi:hypothetical protein
MPSFRIDKVQVGNFPGSAELTCLAPLVPYAVTMTDTTSGEVTMVTACADPTAADCATDSLKRVLHTAGYTMVDDPCT